MAYAGSAVHIACAFSIVEILAVLYRSHLWLGDDGGPESDDRDYLVLSKGHGVMAQYACLRELGWITDNEINNYFGDGTRLKGLADAYVPGIEVTSGSLGHGLSVGVGLALAAKQTGSLQRCFAIVGDGEMNEGSIWEALLFAGHAELSNLMVIVDENGFQAMGMTKEVINLRVISDKLNAFGFETRDVDGHDEEQIDAVVAELWACKSVRPKAVVAHTKKGCGVSFLESNNMWHYKRLTEDTFLAAVAELKEHRRSTE